MGVRWIAKQSSGHNSSNSPNGPVLLDQDVNIQIAAHIPGQGWATIGTALISDGSAAGDITSNDGGPSYPYGGYFSLPDSQFETAGSYANLQSVQLEIWAWTGNYNDPTTAASNNQYVLDNATSNDQNTFNEPVSWDASTATFRADFSNMPALTLAQETQAPGGGSIPPEGLPLMGDANLDGRVDVNDLTIVLTNFGRTGMTWSRGDFTGDGTVDINDLTIVLANFGATENPSLGAVPEPATLVLLAIGALALLLIPRRERG